MNTGCRPHIGPPEPQGAWPDRPTSLVLTLSLPRTWAIDCSFGAEGPLAGQMTADQIQNAHSSATDRALKLLNESETAVSAALAGPTVRGGLHGV